MNESNAKRLPVLKAEVSHCRNLMMSAVHLYAENDTGSSLVALAHTLDANTLPTPATLKYPKDRQVDEWVNVCIIGGIWSLTERTLITLLYYCIYCRLLYFV